LSVAAFLLEMDGRLTAAGVMAIPMPRYCKIISASRSKRYYARFLNFTGRVT